MRIITDIMGGDNAPEQTLLGVVIASQQDYAKDATFVLVGNETIIKELAAKNGYDISGFEIVNSQSVIEMEDDSMAVVKEKKDSSMAIGLKLLADGQGDAFVSCGNTGALFAGASLIVKRVRGIQRAALASVVPFSPPMILMDVGANVKVNEEYLYQFAVMGSAYMSAFYGTKNPRVGLINNGSEETKGTELQIAAYKKMSSEGYINFVGNVEANKMPFDVCDVAVCDGFTGNIVLKSIEGIGKLLSREMKNIFYKNAKTKIAGLMVKNQVGEFKKSFDPTEHGGAPILGISKTVIKAHGSSNAKAFSNAIRQAITCEKNGVCRIIGQEGERFLEEKMHNS